MAFGTYSELQAEIASYLGRSDLATKIPGWISLAEKRFNRKLRLRIMEKVSTALATTAGVASVALPADFEELRQITLATNPPEPLVYVTPDRYAQQAGETGRPTVYSIVGKSLYFAPVPDAAYGLSLTYYGSIPALSEAAPTNDLLTYHPDIYLYGALVESAPWTRTTAPLETWAQFLKTAIEDATSADQRGRFTAQIGMRPIRRL